MRRTYGIVVACLVCVLCAGGAFAGPVFVKLGDIKGESTQEDHPDWIVILAWHLEDENTPNGRACPAKPPGRLVLSKVVDLSTPEIHRLFAECGDVREVVLEALIPDPTSTEPGERVLRARFGGGIRIVRVETGSPSEDDVPTEHITLTYDEVEFEIIEPRRGE